MEYLNPKGTDEAGGGAAATALGGLLSGLGSGGGGIGGQSSTDDLESRTKAWFKAYAEWLNFTEDQSAASRVGQIEDWELSSDENWPQS